MSGRYDYQPRDRSAELPAYESTDAGRAAYRKAVRAQQARDAERDRVLERDRKQRGAAA